MNASVLPDAIAAWGAGEPKIKRVWLTDREEQVDVTVEPQPVTDSEETFAVWIANCERWRAELQARIGRTFDLRWFDPDAAGPEAGKALIYECAP